MTTSKHFIKWNISVVDWLNRLSMTFVNSEVAQLKEEHKQQIGEYQNRTEEIETIIVNSKRDINVSV